jgi:hypothetical protein
VQNRGDDVDLFPGVCEFGNWDGIRRGLVDGGMRFLRGSS